MRRLRLESLGLAVANEIEVYVLEQSDILEDAAELTQLERVGGGGVVTSEFPLQPDAHQPLRLAKGKRPKHDAVDDAEDRGRRADPEREGEDGDEREAGALGERAERVAEVVHRGRGSGIGGQGRTEVSLFPKGHCRSEPGSAACGEPGCEHACEAESADGEREG